jgi:hypothetical protein
VLTWDDKTLRGYRNGAPAGGRALIGPKIAGVPLRIGRSQGLGEPHFKGLIDDVKIYRRAISEAPARHHYEATRRP